MPSNAIILIENSRHPSIDRGAFELPRETPITAADLLNDRVLPLFEEHDVNRGPRPRARRPTASASASTKRCSTSSAVSRSAKRCIVRSTSCRPDLDLWVREYNEQRPNQGRWCFGKGRYAYRKGENDRSLITSDNKTRPLNQAPALRSSFG
jgi:hypothetical protein